MQMARSSLFPDPMSIDPAIVAPAAYKVETVELSKVMEGVIPDKVVADAGDEVAETFPAGSCAER
jgi:hypothetical protein